MRISLNTIGFRLRFLATVRLFRPAVLSILSGLWRSRQKRLTLHRVSDHLLRDILADGDYPPRENVTRKYGPTRNSNAEIQAGLEMKNRRH